MKNDEKIIAALIAENTIPAAAAAAGVHESTIFRRLADDAFRAEYERRRRATLDAACKALQAVMTDAVEVLTGIMKDSETGPSARISAARSVLDYGVKLTELTDLAARVEALEAAAKEAAQ